MLIVNIEAHESNLDKTARLVTPGPYTGRDIYRVRGGYVAMVGARNCIGGLFATIEEARRAQDEVGAGITS